MLTAARDALLLRRAPPDPEHSTPLLWIEAKFFVGTSTWVRTATYFVQEGHVEGGVAPPSLEATVRANVRAAVRANPWLLGHVAYAGGVFRLGQTAYLSWPPPDAVRDRDVEALVDSYSVPASDLARHSTFFSFETFITGVVEERRKTRKATELFGVDIIKVEQDAGATPTYIAVMSLHHAIGDGKTYYDVHAMVFGARPPTALTPHREACFDAGDPGEYFLRFAPKKRGTPIYPGWAILGHMVAQMYSFVWRKLFERLPAGAAARGCGPGIYILAPEEVSRRKGAAVADDVPWVSTNDVVTSWWSAKFPQAHFRCMVMNLRGRSPGLAQELAGNYITSAWMYREGADSPAAIRRLISANEVLQPHRPHPLHRLLEPLTTITNWCTFYNKADVRGYRETRHFPCMGPELLNCNICIVFRLSPGTQAVLVWGRYGAPPVPVSVDDPMIAQELTYFGPAPDVV